MELYREPVLHFLESTCGIALTGSISTEPLYLQKKQVPTQLPGLGGHASPSSDNKQPRCALPCTNVVVHNGIDVVTSDMGMLSLCRDP